MLQHYKLSLDKIFTLNPVSCSDYYNVCTCTYAFVHMFVQKDAKQAIILEDDLEVSPDFFR